MPTTPSSPDWLVRISSIIAPMAPPMIFLGATPLIGGLVQIAETKMFIVVAIGLAASIWLASAMLVVAGRSVPTIAKRLLIGSVLSTTLHLAGAVVGFVAIIGLLTVFAVSFLISLPILILAIWNMAVSDPT